MHEPTRSLLLSRMVLAATIVAIGILLLPDVAVAQAPARCTRPIAFVATDILDLLDSGVNLATVARLVTSCGTSFSIDAGLEERLRKAGADNNLLAVIRRMSPPAGAPPGARWLSPIDGAEMILVGSGVFQMGSPSAEAGRDADESQHRQEIANRVWVDATEVTYAAFRRFVIAIPEWQQGRPPSNLADTHYLSDWKGTDFPEDRADEPVRWISWYSAQAYAAWARKRLPTEAEWEYLARSGTTSRYWWGESFDSARVRGPQSTLRNRESPWGLQDMLGSVWEWTSSLYGPYPYDPGRVESASVGRRVVRGGAINSGEQFLRAANRSAEAPALTSELLGFRTVR